jgi:hypothetical protein
MPEEQPSIEQMIAHLAQQVGQVSQNQAAQAQTLQQLAQGTQVAAQAARQAAQASRPPPDPDGYSRLNEEYLKTLANDPIGLRNAEKAQIANEIALQLRQEMAQTVTEAERRRHAEEMERSIYQQHPHLVSEGPYLEFYLNHLNRSPGSSGWPIEAKVRQAIEWSYENKAERENAIVHAYERSKKEMARASSPGGRSFRDPSGQDQGESESPEAANQKRFEVLQGKRTAAMGGGRYIK